MKGPSVRAYAYFLLLDCSELESQRKGLAVTFPLHITLKGRFSIRDDATVGDLKALGHELLSSSSKFACHLQGPTPVGSLLWFELSKGAEGFNEVVQMHNRLEMVLANRALVAADHIPRAFRTVGFRPHVTIAFDRDDSATGIATTSVRATATFWAIYEYDGTSLDSAARIVYSHRLAD